MNTPKFLNANSIIQSALHFTAIVSLLVLLTTPALAQKPGANRSTDAKAVAAPASTNAVRIDQQTGLTVVCKSEAVPEGFTISGEIFADGCNGSAWIVKSAASAASKSYGPDARRAFEQQSFYLPIDGAANFSEPGDTVAAGQCDAFSQRVKTTYNFNPANLNDVQRDMQAAKLDVFWNEVRQSSRTLLPCLRKALKEHNSGSFFAIDGSMLLVDIDPSPASKALEVRKFISADLDGTDLEYWVRTMSRRGVEGFDTSEAGAKWLAYPNAKYELSMHGGFPIGSFLGAVFIFGSMREELATPVLLRIANDVKHPHRDDAIAILTSQATLASYEALKQMNLAGLSAENARGIRDLIERPNALQPRAHPKLTREENLRAFEGIVNGDYSAFREMVLKAPDGEVDAVATLRAEDIPLLRRARRASISRCNQHAVSDYASFTSILWALLWKYELGKPQPSASVGN